MAAALVAILLAGCGFRPMYSPGGDGAGHPELAAISIEPIPDRVGQQLHNRLLDLINPRGRPVQSRYILKTELTETIEEIGFRKTELATRANLRLRANFALYDVTKPKALLTSSRLVVSSYNILQADYATLVAEEDARNSATREMADEIRTALAIYFAARDDDIRQGKAPRG
jgi:LPS-assembly lipoprotein